MAADAERLLHHAKSAGSQPLGGAGWLQRAGLNIRKASDAQHLEAIALAYATSIRISASPLRAALMAELETLSRRKRSRTTHDLHLIVERSVSYGGSAAVHHGGAGTTHAVVRAGLPSVVASVFADQPFWGARLTRRVLAATCHSEVGPATSWNAGCA